MLAIHARRVAVRAAAAAMTSYAATRAQPRRTGARRLRPRPPALRAAANVADRRPVVDDDDGKVAILRRHFPAAPRAELKRFADARPDGGAVEFYRNYQRWRLEEGSNEALQQRKAAPLVVGGETSPSRFIALGDRLASTDDGVGKRGDRVVLVEGARFDPAQISSSSYAAHVCRTLGCGARLR